VAGRSDPTILSTRAIAEDVEVTESVTYASMNSYGLERISATIGIEGGEAITPHLPIHTRLTVDVKLNY
jgi:hypothetical protein